MKNGLLVIVLALVPSFASPQDTFKYDASSVFGALSGQAEIIAHEVFGRDGIEREMASHQLTKVKSGEVKDSWWAEWRGENSTGRVTASVFVRPLMHPQQNELFLRYEPTTEQPMPQSLLTHLLGKAEETHIYSGDSVQIRLPFEHVAGCMKQYRLEVRLTTGALVENVLDMTCQAMKTQQ